MKVITLTNEKGGVGKTTLALHIAAGLALEDRRVLLIDGDAQGHCATGLKVPKASGLYDLLVREAEWNKVVVVPPFASWGGTLPTTGSLMLLPSNEETRVIPLMVDDPMLLRERLADIEDAIDVVVIDTSPTPNMLQTLLYMASDYVICPTECEELSLDGLNGATLRIEKQNAARVKLGISAPVELMGLVPTMYTNTLAHQHGIELLEAYVTKKFHDLSLIWPAIPQRTIWRESAFAHKTLYAYAPESEVTAEMVALVDRVAEYV